MCAKNPYVKNSRKKKRLLVVLLMKMTNLIQMKRFPSVKFRSHNTPSLEKRRSIESTKHSSKRRMRLKDAFKVSNFKKTEPKLR